MEQVHRRFSTDHVRNLFRGYTEGLIERSAIEETLGINKSRFLKVRSLHSCLFRYPFYCLQHMESGRFTLTILELQIGDEFLLTITIKGKSSRGKSGVGG